MADAVTYAVLANRVYNRNAANRGPIPDGWEEILYAPDNLVGFSAGAYRNTLTGEVIISYTGTNEAFVADWSLANIPAGLGNVSPQVEEAIRFYSDVRQAVGSAPISLTGHSLGGGLASLISVYFDEPATVFDTAPFQASALNLETVEHYLELYQAYQSAQNRSTKRGQI